MTNSRITYIYLLLDIDGDPRYVGKTVNMKWRLAAHRCQGHTWMDRAIILEVIPPWIPWKERETYWIEYYLRFAILYNIRLKGGGGIPPGRKQSTAHIEAHRKAITGRPQTKESNAKRSAALKGRIKSESTRAKIRANANAQWGSIEGRQKKVQGIRAYHWRGNHGKASMLEG